MSVGTCVLCFSINVKIFDVKDTHLQPVYEKVTSYEIQNETYHLCFVCRTRLQQCHHLVELALISQNHQDGSNMVQCKCSMQLSKIENENILMPPNDVVVKKEPENEFIVSETMKNKLTNLRDTSKKCKQSKQTSSGQAAKKLANMKWADPTSFIDPSINLRQTDSTLETGRVILDTSTMSTIHENSTETEAEEEDSNNEPNKLGIVQELETGETTAETNLARKISGRRRHVSNEDNAEKIISYLKTVKGNTGTEKIVKIACDRTDIVFLGYADTVKKLSLHKQVGIKPQITNIITQAQLQVPDTQNITDI